jgi:hypothetical protein
MSTEKSIFANNGPSTPHPMMRLVNTQHPVLAGANAADRIADSADPRWVFAMRARLVVERGMLTDQSMDRLQTQAQRMGLSMMQSKAVIGILERAQGRDGFDHIAHDELMRLPEIEPEPNHELSDRARWLTFGVLFGWALLIAGVMQVVT